MRLCYVVVQFFSLIACFRYVNTIPVYSVDDFEKDENRIDENFVEPTGLFESLWRIESPAEYIRALQASLMKSLMDPTADPCEDFYQYTCGNWEKLFPIPDDKSENNVFALLNNNIVYALKELLSADTATVEMDEEDDALQKARTYYTSCIDQETRNKRGAAPLLDLLNQYGGWPVLDENWSSENFDWVELIAKLTHIDLGIFVSTGVDADLKDSSRTAIHLSEASWGLESKEDYAPGSDSLQAYEIMIEEVLRLLNISEEVAKQTSEEIIDFEMKLVNITPKSLLRANFSEMYGSLTYEELLELHPYFDWENYLTIAYGKPVDFNQTVVVSLTPYLDILPQILSNTDNKTIANYIGWRVVYYLMEYLDSNFVEVQHKFDQALTGQQKAEPLWKKCVKETNNQLAMAVGAMFVRAYFDEASKNDLQILAEEIKEAFIESLDEMEWLDPVTKQAAEIKANLTRIAVGYPNDILITHKLNMLYANLNVKKDTHFENAVNAAKNEKIRINNQLSHKYDKNFWVMSPAIVNAYFEQTQNQIVVPAASLQPPLYHRHYPKFLNYGGMGYFIGHELTHGFDDVGREFNSAGNMIEWWSEESIKGFDERTKCFSAQYSTYSMHGKPLDGFLSRGENIADNGGVRQAFYAYKKWLRKNKNSDVMLKENLAGFNMSHEKMFFIQFAQGWCGSIRPEAIDNMLNTDHHCPGKFRVIGTLSNFDEFSKEFNCPVGSKMNPSNKCRMW